jgi:hypothetical protein
VGFLSQKPTPENPAFPHPGGKVPVILSTSTEERQRGGDGNINNKLGIPIQFHGRKLYTWQLTFTIDLYIA